VRAWRLLSAVAAQLRTALAGNAVESRRRPPGSVHLGGVVIVQGRPYLDGDL
jgi:hypothetical protein